MKVGIIGIGLILAVCNALAGEVKIGSLVAAQVAKVHVKLGDEVKVGQALITLDDSRYRAKLNALQAEVRYRELALADAKIEFEQQQDLFDRTVIARRPFERAKLDYDLAAQAFERAKADLALHQAWSNYVYIKAPVAAKVTALAVTQGTTVFDENQLLIVLETQQ
ncbi:MAG: biotin/lipoyl-binding protein [Thiomicrospira sp.]|jgi:RND family efflux transporter MFP subunit|nr:biotin/lipoyl-binding protein [Thiomicrospira sp.]